MNAYFLRLGFIALAAVSLAAVLPALAPAADVGSAFTYQGQLVEDGSPAGGDYDFEVALYATETGPGLIATTVTVINVTVENGLFALDLDFGASAFNGQKRYLDIGVRPNGDEDEDFTRLEPRQELKASPYAIRAANATTAQNVEWRNIDNKPDERIRRTIYVPAAAMNYAAGSDIDSTLRGLRWPDTGELAGFGVSQPRDWDKSTSFTVKLYFALYTAGSPGFVQWRLHAGTSNLNLPVDYPDSGWDQIYFGNEQDADLLAYGAAGGHSYLMKVQSWTSKWSDTYDTWYFGESVTTGNDFYGDPMWYFYFERGAGAGNDETYSGNMYVVGAAVEYITVK